MKKIAMLLVGVITLFLIGSTFAQDIGPEAGKLYNEGNSLLKAGNYKGAIENYNNALAIEKD